MSAEVQRSTVEMLEMAAVYIHVHFRLNVKKLSLASTWLRTALQGEITVQAGPKRLPSENHKELDSNGGGF